MSKFVQEYFKGRSPSDIPHSVIAATVKEILNIAENKLHKKASELKVLDVGSGWGEYAFELESYVKEVVGVEPYKKLCDVAVKNKFKRKSKVVFHNLAVEKFDTKEKFDLIISLTTIEHMPNAEKSFRQMFSMLKEGGMIYATAPNKLWLFESHYGLPALAWLPLRLQICTFALQVKDHHTKIVPIQGHILGWRNYLIYFLVNIISSSRRKCCIPWMRKPRNYQSLYKILWY